MSVTDQKNSRNTKIGPGRAWLALLFFTILIVVAIIGQTWWSSAQDRRLSLELETSHAMVASRALEEHASQILHDTNRMIDATVHAIQKTGNRVITDEAALRRILIDQTRDTTYLQSLRYIDTAGVSRVTSFLTPRSPIDVSDRLYIQFLANHPDRTASAIGHPIKSRYDGQWIVPVARNLFDASGQRIGMISAYIRVSYFENFYNRMAQDHGAIVSLISDRGFVLIHSPFDEHIAGMDISNSPIMRRIRAGSVEGAFQARWQFDKAHLRLLAYRKFIDFPVTAIYARDLDDVMSAWQQRTLNRILFSSIACSCILALALLLALHIRRLQKLAHNLSDSENRYRILYECGNDAVMLWDRNQIYVDCNPAALRLFGVSDKQHVIGRKIGIFSPQEQPSRSSYPHSREQRIAAALNGEPQYFEWTTLRRGKPCHSDVTLSRAEINDEVLVLAVFHDISAQKQAQSLQIAQNHILHMIAAGSELAPILTNIILFVEQHAPHARCTILLVDDSQTYFSHCVAPSLPPQQVTNVIGMPVAAGNGCSSEAVLSRCPVVVEDMAEDPIMQGLLARIGPLPFASSGSWPIMGKHGQILGAFSMLYLEHQTPDAADMQLIGISTDLAGVAIESRKAEERILHLAHYDELSGLPNRFLFIQHLDKALAHAERQQGSIAVMFLDLDRFKNINDTFGHEAGDQVLRDTAIRMRSCLRDQDTIARVGGDEFLTLIEDYRDPVKLGEIAQRLLLEAAQPFDINGHEYQLSVSIGIATYPADGVDTPSLLKNADIAMYRAKTTGKNNYQFYSAEMNTHTVERAALDARLRKAIEKREFVVYYQPKVDVRSECIVGAEALVRWQHPERGLLLPGEFIGLAEDAGLIGPLGMMVLDIACRDIVSFGQQCQPFGRVAINLSASQFNHPDLLGNIQHTVNSWGVAPSSLEFEITESMVMHNRDQAMKLMDHIRALGFTLSIDDFGTGYSSLAYLKRFPVNSVKIDKSFINDIPQGANDSAIVQAIIAMAHTLGLEVTAEGVETKIQLETLEKFDCDTFQGFYFSKAVPATQFMALLQTQQREQKSNTETPV